MHDIGEVFAGFTIEAMLGQGGMGTVYLARHPRLDRLTALKLLNPDLFADSRIRARFEREADLAAGLDHPGIVTVYDRGTEGEQLWISMQYVDGIDAATVDPMALPPERAVQIIEGVADALDYAHGRGVLHRDVKPANILLARSSSGQGERVFLTDFGIARLRADSTHLTQQGMFTATLAYASPEQMTGSELDHRSDQYSLACSLYWLFTGIAPFDSVDPNEIIRGTLYAPPPPLALRRTGLPPAMDAVLAAAMAKHPAARFDSCTAFAEAARQALTATTPPVLPRPPANPGYYPPAPHAGAPAPGYPAPPMQAAPQHNWQQPPRQPGGAVPPAAPVPPAAGPAAAASPNAVRPVGSVPQAGPVPPAAGPAATVSPGAAPPAGMPFGAGPPGAVPQGAPGRTPAGPPAAAGQGVVAGQADSVGRGAGVPPAAGMSHGAVPSGSTPSGAVSPGGAPAGPPAAAGQGVAVGQIDGGVPPTAAGPPGAVGVPVDGGSPANLVPPADAVGPGAGGGGGLGGGALAVGGSPSNSVPSGGAGAPVVGGSSANPVAPAAVSPGSGGAPAAPGGSGTVSPGDVVVGARSDDAGTGSAASSSDESSVEVGAGQPVSVGVAGGDGADDEVSATAATDVVSMPGREEMEAANAAALTKVTAIAGGANPVGSESALPQGASSQGDGVQRGTTGAPAPGASGDEPAAPASGQSAGGVQPSAAVQSGRAPQSSDVVPTGIGVPVDAGQPGGVGQPGAAQPGGVGQPGAAQSGGGGQPGGAQAGGVGQPGAAQQPGSAQAVGVGQSGGVGQAHWGYWPVPKRVSG
ncbi:serine/threonine-protein kinase, partial [Nocardia lasii]